jgi:hypothetical protein
MRGRDCRLSNGVVPKGNPWAQCVIDPLTGCVEIVASPLAAITILGHLIKYHRIEPPFQLRPNHCIVPHRRATTTN